MPAYGARLARRPKRSVCHVRLKHGDLPDSLFDSKQLAAGVNVELEHTDDKSLAKQIAKSHLVESGDYYKYLPKFEKQLRTNWLVRPEAAVEA
jgi:hypothetical protein